MAGLRRVSNGRPRQVCTTRISPKARLHLRFPITSPRFFMFQPKYEKYLGLIGELAMDLTSVGDVVPEILEANSSLKMELELVEKDLLAMRNIAYHVKGVEARTVLSHDKAILCYEQPCDRVCSVLKFALNHQQIYRDKVQLPWPPNCSTVLDICCSCLDPRKADTTFRKQPCPLKFTFLSLVVILGGAVGYVMTDPAFSLTAWALAYLVIITTETVYIKHIVTNLGLNTWGFVLYNNLLSLMLAPIFWFVKGEHKSVLAAIESRGEGWFHLDALVTVALSCVFGYLISFFGFAARKAVSATAFTVTGVVNKFLTVPINVLIWDKHATAFGLVCLLFTIVGGALYQQSVTTKGNSAAQHGPVPEQPKDDNHSNDFDEQKQSLVSSVKQSNA
ncbi:GDP-fucose transporter 1-like [Phragmites australis]|uniref:GDP-fucose transporter 1-like n=1 Tax=Phragmites australis TaxID=29695 RepID=UPI002D764EB0|nr:GDP-fucose transporter 1-like [Phragmites australis]